MASANSKVGFEVFIDGQSEFFKTLEQMQQRWKSVNEEIKRTKESMDRFAATGDLQGFTRANDDFTRLTATSQALKKAINETQKGISDVDTILGRMGSSSLKQMKSDLNALKSGFKFIDPSEKGKLEKYSKAMGELNYRIKEAEKATRAAIMPEKELQSILSNLNTAPISKLKQAHEELARKVNETTRGTKEWKEASEKLGIVKEQIDVANKSLGKHTSVLGNAISRLKTYVLVYLGFSKLMDIAKDFATSTLQLSDSIADVQKTTGMTSVAVNNLSRAIDDIDTRTSQEQLHKLAYQAGMLGLNSYKDVMGFVRGANELNTALNELGEEGAVELMKVANVTGEIKKYGVEESLKRIGSAINEITASSPSAASPIVDIVSRLGSVGSTAGYTSYQLTAIASTLDSLHEPAEKGSTAMARVMMALKTNLSNIAADLGVTKTEIESAGGSMEQLIFVLERLKQMADENGNYQEVLQPFFKDMGSEEGVRLRETLTLMVGNVDMLKEHLGITTAAFEEATSMTDEYNVRNENAAAYVERAGNAIREKFINSGLTEWLKNILRYVADVFEHMENHGTILGIVRGGLAALVAIMAKKTWATYSELVGKITLRFNNLWQSLKTTAVYTKQLYELELAFGKTRKAAIIDIAAQALGLEAVKGATIASTIATGAATVAVNIFHASLKAIGIGFLIEGLALATEWIGKLVGWLWDGTTSLLGFRTEVDSSVSSISGAAQATSEFNKEVEAENQRMLQLYTMLGKVESANQKDKKTHQEKVSLINIINTKYGQYLSNLLTEASSYDDIRRAVAKANTELKIQYALKMKSKLLDAAEDDKNKNLEKVNSNIGLNLGEMWGKKGWTGELKVTREQMEGKIWGYIMTAADKKLSSLEVQRGIRDLVRKNLKGSLTVYGEHQIDDLASNYEKYAEEVSKFNARKEAINSYVVTQANAIGLDVTANDIRKAEENQQMRELTGLQSDYNNELKTTKEYLTESYINEADPATLPGWHDKLQSLARKKHGNAERQRLFKEYFGIPEPEDAAAAAKYISDMDSLIKQKMNPLGYNEGGTFRHTSIGNRGGGHTNKNDFDESEAAIAKLNAYYKERNMLIETSLANEEITEEEGARRKDILEQEHLERRAMLRKTFVKANTDDEQAEMKKWWSDLVEEGKLATVDWGNISKEWARAKKEETATNIYNWTKDLNDSKKILAKMAKELHKALLEYDPVQKVLDGLRSNLDAITVAGQKDGKDIMGSLLGIGIDESDTEYTKKIEDRFNFIFQHVKDAVSMGASELRTLMQGEDGVWASVLGDEELKLLLLRMEDFQDKYMQAIRQQAAKLKARIAQEMKESGETQERAEIERRSKNREESAKLVGGVSYFGASEKSLQGTTWADEAALDTMRMKIQLENEYMYALAERQRQELEAAEKIEDANKREQEQLRITEEYKILAAEHTKTLMELNQQYATQLSEDAMKVTEQISPYADAMVEFADKFGAAVFGSKEDRQQAAKDLLISVIDTTSKILTQYLIMLATKRTFNKIEQIEEEAKNANMLQSRQSLAAESIGVQAGEMSASLAMTGAETTGDIAAKGAQGSAKEVAKHGLIGLAIGAAITLAMTALTSLIKGKINQSISEVNSIAGTKGKKVAASMLTYAEGNYPVLGSDGVVYNAKREDNWQTKVYRSPHYGILGEKGPELIVDGNTTRVMMTQRPDLYNEIMYLSQGMRTGRARVYATGNLQEMPALQAAVPSDDMATQQMIVLQQQLDANNQVMTLLVQQLANGITIAPLGKNGAVNRLNAAQKWMQKHGL